MSLLMLLAAGLPGLLGLTELPPQKPEPGHCRTFLWAKTQTPFRIAMIDETARTMRMRRGKQMFDIAAIGPNEFGGHGYKVTVSLRFAATDAIQSGAVVDSGSMRIEQLGGETMVIPVGGMRGCEATDSGTNR